MEAILRYIARLGQNSLKTMYERRNLGTDIRASYNVTVYAPSRSPIRHLASANLVLVAAMNYIGFCLHILPGGITYQRPAKDSLSRQAARSNAIALCKSADLRGYVVCENDTRRLEIWGDIYDSRNR